jgi:hypothetical protein
MGSFLWGKACKVGSAIDTKISESEKLSRARDVTKQKLQVVGQVLNTSLVEVIDKVSTSKKGDLHQAQPVIGAADPSLALTVSPTINNEQEQHEDIDKEPETNAGVIRDNEIKNYV